MEYWMNWLIVAGIGLVAGFVIHTIMRYAQGVSIIATLLGGIIGAFFGAFIIAPYLMAGITSQLGMMFIWAAVGAIVLSFIVELLFVGTRRGRVITS